jgi:hypothetical protein
MNTSAIAACCNRNCASRACIRLNVARIKTSQWPGHLPHKLNTFNNGGATAYPTAQSAQNSSPVFITSFWLLSLVLAATQWHPGGEQSISFYWMMKWEGFKPALQQVQDG